MSAQRMQGFTLLEVVIAFAILGISLAVLYGAFASALSRARRDAQLSEATMLAQSLLARAGEDIPSAQGSYDGDWNGYRYELTQELIGAPSQKPALTIPAERVTARVQWTGNNGARKIEISTLKFVRKVLQ